MNLTFFYTFATIAAMHGITIFGRSCSSDPVSLQATDDIQVLESPGYPHRYQKNQLCRWIIKADKKYQVVRIRLTDMRISNSVACQADFLQIQDGSYIFDLTLKKCCKGICSKGEVVTTSEQETLLTFASDNSANSQGFQLEYWAVVKTLSEDGQPELSTINFLLFGIFAAIVSSILITVLCIFISQTYPLFCYNLFRKLCRGISNKHQTANGSMKRSNSTSNVEYDPDISTVSTTRNNDNSKLSATAVYIDDGSDGCLN